MPLTLRKYQEKLLALSKGDIIAVNTYVDIKEKCAFQTLYLCKKAPSMNDKVMYSAIFSLSLCA